MGIKQNHICYIDNNNSLEVIIRNKYIFINLIFHQKILEWYTLAIMILSLIFNQCIMKNDP